VPSEKSLGLPLASLPWLLRFMAADNMERGFNHAELALAAPWLELLPTDKDPIRNAYGLQNPRLYEGVLLASAYGPELALRGLTEGYLDPENLLAIKDWEDKEREALILLFQKLKPGYQKRRIWADLLNDLRENSGERDGGSNGERLRERDGENNGKRKNLRIDQLLSEDFFQNLSGPKDEEKGREKLYTLRNPRLAAFREKRESLLKALGTPKGASFKLSDNLEDLSGKLDINFESPEELEITLKSLFEILQGGAFHKVWNLPWDEGEEREKTEGREKTESKEEKEIKGEAKREKEEDRSL
jgi:hypothetical protein